jgi:hypothetical protein
MCLWPGLVVDTRYIFNISLQILNCRYEKFKNGKIPYSFLLSLLKIPVFEKKNRMSFTRIALETHITHMSTGVKFYWLAS